MFAAIAAALLAGAVAAAENDPLPPQVEIGGVPLVRNGMATRTVWTFPVYRIGLYLTSPSKDAEFITGKDRGHKSIRISMQRPVDKEQFTGTVQESINRNFTDEEKTGFVGELEKFLGCFHAGADLKEGTLVTIDYLPEKGMLVAVDQRQLAVIPGDGFYHAILRLWLGKPIQASIKPALLGQADE
jgi:hypothetical protein